MRITSKGQVTIPIELRTQAGLLPNTEVTFEFRNGELLLKKSPGQATRGQKLVERMRGKATIRMTTDEIMALTRGED
jgi:AbrB family looped-hinge helix DNA binding protein